MLGKARLIGFAGFRCLPEGLYEKTGTVAVLSTRKVDLPILLAAAFIAYWLSESVRYGDSPYYAQQLATGVLIEPGHLIWRPLGALVYFALGRANYSRDALWVIQGISLVASVASVAAVFAFLSKSCSRQAALLCSGLFAFSNGFWYYAFSGSSYSLSVFFLALAFNSAIPFRSTPHEVLKGPLFSGLFGGLAALSWLLQGLNLPSLLLANALFARRTSRRFLVDVGRNNLAFLVGYSLTLGLPLCGAYLGSHFLDSKLYHYAPNLGITGFLHWLSSASHGIQTAIGTAQFMRLVLGWSQSVLSAGDIGATVRLWLLESENGNLPMHPGFISLVAFYGCLAIALFFIWRDRALLSTNQKKLLAVSAISVVGNLSFAFCWQPSDMERYLPSIGLVIAVFAIAIDGTFLNSKRGRVVGFMAISTVAGVNWFGTFYPSLAEGSYKQQWLAQTREHMNGSDLLIVLGNRKYELVAPHSSQTPRILNISRIVAMNRTAEWRQIAERWIGEALEHDGRVMIGDSVLGLDLRPRDGWSFTEYPTPSPRDLNDFFAPMKGELVFTASGERVWLLKSQHCCPN